MEGFPPVTPMTALIVDDDGRLTYVGADGGGVRNLNLTH